MQDLIELFHRTESVYGKYYDVHICSPKEIDEVLSFIDKYWQKGHILTKSKELLDWQHFDKGNDRYNFVLAKHKQTGEIHGLIGFITSNIFDESIKTPIRWGAIWKVRNDVAIKGLGVYLKGYMEENVPSKYIGGVGLSNDSREIDTKLGERVGKLNQYYIVNPKMDTYSLVKNVKPVLFNPKSISGCGFTEINEKRFVEESMLFKEKIMPYKSVIYYVNRYFRHPIYKYKCALINNCYYENNEVFVYRVCNALGKRYIFIVDYIGNGEALRGAYNEFCQLLMRENAECICFPCEGIDDKLLMDGGFRRRDDTDVVLPIYFEPFVCQNIELDYHFWPNDQECVLVKGDADQDRPNMLPEDYR